MNIPEFCDRLIYVLHPPLDGELPLEDCITEQPVSEVSWFFEELDTPTNVAARRGASLHACKEGLKVRFLDGRIYFEHPTTKGRLVFSPDMVSVPHVAQMLMVPISLLQIFAYEEYGIEVVWESSSDSFLSSAKELFQSRRREKKDGTIERYQQWIDKALELRLRNSQWSVSELARRVKRELNDVASSKTIQNTLYDSKKF